MPIKRVGHGDRLRIGAGDWNKIADVVDAATRGDMNGGAGKLLSSLNRQSQILVRNTGDNPVARFGALGYVGPLIEPGVRLSEFLNRPALEGEATLGRAGPNPVLIAQAPIRAGGIGPCTIDGVTVAMVKVIDARHRYADTAAGQATLVSAWAGPAKIVHLAENAPEAEEPEDPEDPPLPAPPDVRPALVILGNWPTDFEAVIDGAPVQDGSAWVWAYPFTETIRKKGGTLLADGEGLRTGSAYNHIEGGNVTSTSIAPGILQSDYPATTVLCLPIAEGTPVVVTEVWPEDWEPGDEPLFRINVPNAPKVNC